MARLTEEMVIARSRVSDLSAIKKLNCWGGELADVSILRRMSNLEVLSISVNKISSLADFQYCKKLRELYVRNNEISGLNQICYLQQLPALKILWLAENPCAKEDIYRLTVLKALPHLEKLDDVVVQPEEVEDAQRKGKDLIHPEDDDAPPPAAVQKPRSAPVRPQQKPVRQPSPEPEEIIEEERYHPASADSRRPVRRFTDYTNEKIPHRPVNQLPEDEYEEDERYRQVSRPTRRSTDFTNERAPHRPVNQLPPEPEIYSEEERYRSPTDRRPSEISYEPVSNISNQTNGSDGSSTVCEKCCSPLSPAGGEVVREGGEWEPAAPTAPASPSNQTNGDTNLTNLTTNHDPLLIKQNGGDTSPSSPKDRYDVRDEYRRRGSSSSSNGSLHSRSRTGSPPSRRVPTHEDVPVNNGRYPSHNAHPNAGRYKQPSPPRRNSRPIRNEADQHGVERLQSNIDEYLNGSSVEHQRWIANMRDHEPRRTASSNPNLVTAVICLIMELDYDGLVQVDKVLRRRRDEIGEDYLN